MPPALGTAPGPLLGAVPPVLGEQLQTRLSLLKKHLLPPLGAYSILGAVLVFYMHDFTFLKTTI